MTNHWIDLKNSDCIMIMGSNAAENHPMSFKYVTQAMDNGATLINVDPRFTRTSAKADLFAQIRPGTDIAFINGLIRYAIENGYYHEAYVRNYTNALCKINEGFDFTDGLFTGYDAASKSYADKSTWQYQKDGDNNVFADDLDDPDCAFQLLRNHVSRYTPKVVSQITGVSESRFLEIAEAYVKGTYQDDKVGTIMYAMGWTQHTTGVQNIRAFSILQLLLGNMGRAGGGVNALRGESNVQGSTDHGLLSHLLPGYLKAPAASDQTLADYLTRVTPANINGDKSVNYWKNTKKFVVSLLKDYYGESATAENDFLFNNLPKTSGDYSHMALFKAMDEGIIKGLICMGQNPAVGGPNAEHERSALEKLDWLIVADLWETETAVFWKRDGATPSAIKTEVFLLPAAASFEKEGTVTNSGRWAQWRYQAISPPGNAKSDAWMLHRLGAMLQFLYLFKLDFTDPFKSIRWDHVTDAEGGPDPSELAKRINGYNLTDNTLLSSFANLADDGTTSSGSWIYCGSYTENGNMTARRDRSDANDESGIGLYSNWSWCWPVNRRIIYNRASCDTNGDPWDPAKKVIWWDGSAGEWKGGDVPDFVKTSAPSAGVGPFIMRQEGLGRLFGMALADGPLPEHYEPFETPLAHNPVGTGQLRNPCIKIYNDEPGSSSAYPYVATTYRVSEHWQSGSMTRNLPWLCELIPNVFVEISETLAEAKDIRTGAKVRVVSARGQMEAYALVTPRIQQLRINGGTACEVVGIIWHFGYQGIATGDSGNCLTPNVGDPNTMIPEYKAFLVNIEKIVF